MLRSFDLENENLVEDNPFDYFLQVTVWDIRSTNDTPLQATPCQLVFGRDMIHNIVFKANWNQIQKKKQDIVNCNMLTSKKKRKHY